MDLLITELDAVSSLQELRPQLAPAEWNRLSGMRDSKRARLRAHAYVAIRNLLQLHPQEARIVYDSDGRPRLYGLPFDISISHKHPRVLAGIVSSPLRIGVDLEDLDEQIDTAAFSQHALNSYERDQVGNQRGLAISMWCVKESFCKCAGYPYRPTDLTVHFDSEAGHVAVEPNRLLQGFLLARGYSRPETKISRTGRWVRATTVMQ